MRIAFDDKALLSPSSKNRGIGNYALGMFKNLIELDKDNEYFFFNVLEKYSFSSNLIDLSNLTEEYFYCGKNNFIIKDAEYSEIFGDLIKKFIKKNDIDVFYITSPFDGVTTLYKEEWFKDVKVIVVVYDLIPLIMGKHYLPNKAASDFYNKCLDNISWADRYVVISESVKIDMVNYLGYDPNDIDVIYHLEHHI